MEDIKDELNKIKGTLLAQLQPMVIILFGSYARNTADSQSDIDIAFRANGVNKEKVFKLIQELETLTNKDIDLVNLDDIGDGFRYEILMSGITLYCQDQYKFDLYKLDMFREYLELNESRQSIINNIKNGGTIYGK